MMHSRYTYVVLMLLTGVLLAGLAGCGSARRGAPVQPALTLSEPQAEHGQRVFMTFCNGCHPGGSNGLAPAINNKPLPAFAIRYQVRHGLGVMPAFSEEVISEEELDALVEYLFALRYHPAPPGADTS